MRPVNFFCLFSRRNFFTYRYQRAYMGTPSIDSVPCATISFEIQLDFSTGRWPFRRVSRVPNTRVTRSGSYVKSTRIPLRASAQASTRDRRQSVLIANRIKTYARPPTPIKTHGRCCIREEEKKNQLRLNIMRRVQSKRLS